MKVQVYLMSKPYAVVQSVNGGLQIEPHSPGLAQKINGIMQRYNLTADDAVKALPDYLSGLMWAEFVEDRPE